MSNGEMSVRPWGKYLKFHQEPGVWVKRIEVNPGGRLSLQKHSHRSEKWIIVAGEGLAIVDDVNIPVLEELLKAGMEEPDSVVY